MPQTEFDRALDYGKSALSLLKKGRIPPHPPFYELLYTYATGINPDLNARINEVLGEGKVPDTRMAQQLQHEFLSGGELNDRINSVSQAMSAQIDSVNDSIDGAMAATASYSGSLEAASGHLDSNLDPDALKALAKRLLGETKRMQKANKTLESKLGESRKDIAGLQNDLDEVRRESMLDPLTKIYNRKFFDDGLVKELASARETGEALSLLMIDIDHFKKFNDTYGHQVGDQVLRLVAMTLKSNIKGRDMAARYGGEEFVAVLPATNQLGATTVAESIREAIQAKKLLKRSTNEKLGRITASFGVAEYRTGESAADLIGRADRRLYAAKKTGRNRVVSKGEDTPQSATQSAA